MFLLLKNFCVCVYETGRGEQLNEYKLLLTKEESSFFFFFLLVWKPEDHTGRPDGFGGSVSLRLGNDVRMMRRV